MVYRARDTRLGRDVAVKLLQLGGTGEIGAPLRAVIRQAARLRHPAIVTLYDYGDPQDTTENTSEGDTEAIAGGAYPYLVTEYVAGRTLQEVLADAEPLAPGRAVAVAAEVCAALQAAHEHGVVHGDLKPANVMIDQTGAVKVTDFGLTQALRAVEPDPQTPSPYRAPEQARGRPGDARSDVYAAGGVLFAMLTGFPPTPPDDAAAEDEPHPLAPSAVNPAGSPDLDALVLRARAPNPAERYPSAGALRTALLDLQASPPAAATVADTPAAGDGDGDNAGAGTTGPEPGRARGRLRRRVALLGLLVVAVLGGAAGAAFALLGGPSPVAVPTLTGVRVSVATARLQQLGLRAVPHRVYCQAGPTGTPAPCRAGQAGTLLATNPPAGSNLPPGSPVQLDVAAPPQQVTIPTDLRGATPAAAAGELHRLGLRVAGHHATQPVTDPSLVGTVIGTDPPAATPAAKGSLVTLTLGAAPPQVTVPDETGIPAPRATSAMQNRGLLVALRHASSPTDPAGTVLDQQPTGGHAVVTGSTVTLTVSTGPPATSAPSPAPPSGPGGVLGQRGPNGLGTYICTPAEYTFAGCRPDTLGHLEHYPYYTGHGPGS